MPMGNAPKDAETIRDVLLKMKREGKDTTAYLDEINAGLQHDLSDWIKRTYAQSGDINPWLDAVAKDLKAGNKDGAVHLLQSIVIALTK